MEENRALGCHGIFGADDGDDEDNENEEEQEEQRNRGREEDDPEDEEEPVWTAVRGADSDGER